MSHQPKKLLQVPLQCTRRPELLFRTSIFKALYGTCLIPSPGTGCGRWTGHCFPDLALPTLNKDHNTFPWFVPGEKLCSSLWEIFLRLLWRGGMKWVCGQPWSLKCGLDFQLCSWHGAQQWRVNCCLLIVYPLISYRVQHSAKLILSAENPDCSQGGYDSITDFTCLPVLFPLHIQSAPVPNCSVVSSGGFSWEKRIWSSAEGPSLEREHTCKVEQHKLIYSFEINKLIPINFPQGLFADEPLSPIGDVSMLGSRRHL